MRLSTSSGNPGFHAPKQIAERGTGSGVCYTMLIMPALKTTLAVALILAIILNSGSALAKELRSVEVTRQPYFIEVALGFDSRPAYTESMRYDPDRYLLTLSSCSLGVPSGKLAEFDNIGHNLLTRISTYSGRSFSIV